MWVFDDSSIPPFWEEPDPETSRDRRRFVMAVLAIMMFFGLLFYATVSNI